MAKEIPGFYFDEQKHKYYKIQPNHIAPKDSKYSREAVDIEKEATLVGNSIFCSSLNARCVFLDITRAPKTRKGY